MKEYYYLPNGERTIHFAKYYKEWKELARSIEVLSGETLELMGFDPDLQFREKKGNYKTITLPLWFVKLVYKNMEVLK